MLPVRISFSKTGSIKFISHLDLNRTFRKIIIRAGLPLAYSEGFNPHPKITFASTLSLGVESLHEYVDVKLLIDSYDTIDDIEWRIKNAAPPALCIDSVYAPQSELKEIHSSKYEIYICTECKADGLADLFKSEFLVERIKNKKSRNPTVETEDILPMISFLSAREDSGYKVITLKLPSNSVNYINPELIASKISKIYNVSDYFFKKISMHRENEEIFR